MILIVSTANDLHAQKITQELDLMGANYRLLDLAHFPKESALTINYGGKQKNKAFKFEYENEETLNLEDVKVAWWRRPQGFAMHDDVQRDSHRNFAFGECHEAVSGLWHALNVHWVNNPSNDNVAHRKAYQLRVAQEIGLRIPETCITSNPTDARHFLNNSKIEKKICKSFSATVEEWRETRLVTVEEEKMLPNVKYAPVIFQEYIEAQYDIRITVIGEHIFPAAIYSQETEYKIDMRMDIGNARMEAVKLPKSIEDKLRLLMKKLGLVYGAIDFRLTPEGEYVFLEINPAGQWLFVEDCTKQPITKTFASYLNSFNE